MTVRPATLSDHAAMAAVCSAAFFDEHLFGTVMHPRRNQYPNDPALFWHKFIRHEWTDWRNKAFVKVVRDEKVGGKERIVGVAIWQRQGEGGKKMALSALDPRKIVVPLTRLSNGLNTYLYPNRALDPTKTNLLPEAMPFCAHHWAGDRAENWYLALLAVEPSWQGKGFGRDLVEWGIQQADKENIHASVMSSSGKEDFYMKCGFEEIVGNATEGDGNPLSGIPGGAILFRYPKYHKQIESN